MRLRSTTLVLLASMTLLLAACGSGGSDKAGGVTAPATLRIAAHHYHNFFATLFTDEVRRLSKGRIRIEFIPGTGDDDPADASVRFAKQVRDGRYDLGVVDARTWDELGVGSLQPLQAPLLITDQSQYRAVLASPLADRMLAGLQSQHVVGLSLMMSELEHPVGDFGPLTSPAAFRGKRIVVLPVSRVSDAVISALGATPVHLTFEQIGPSRARHTIDGQVMPAFARPNVWLTPNVTFSATALTVFANEQRFAKLSDQQQRILRTAAAHAAQRSAGVMASDPEVGLVERHCQRGHVVVASRAELAAFEQAVRPVYAQLERDPQVRATIAAIRELKRRTPPAPAPKIPASCSRTATSTDTRARDPSFLDGTYRWRITRAGAVKVGGRADDDLIGKIVTATLRHGRFVAQTSDSSDTGTFKVTGNRIAFNTPSFGYTNTFTFKRRADGTLDLKAVLPMDAGDRVFSSSAPWTRVGPSVRKVP